MAPVLVEDGSFKVGAPDFYLLVLGLLPPAHQHAGCEVGPPFLLDCPQGETVHLAFRSLMILIVLHVINNYYEGRPPCPSIYLWLSKSFLPVF